MVNGKCGGFFPPRWRYKVLGQKFSYSGRFTAKVAIFTSLSDHSILQARNKGVGGDIRAEENQGHLRI